MNKNFNESVPLEQGIRRQLRGGLKKATRHTKTLLLFFLLALFSKHAAAQPNCADVTGPAQVCTEQGNQVYMQTTCFPSTYLWSLNTGTTNATIVGSNTGSTITINPGTQEGTYTVTVTATAIFNGAVATGSRSTAVTRITLGLTAQNALCFGNNNGSVTATFTNGFPNYQVRIDGGSYSVQTSPYTFTGLTAGVHTVDVFDSRGCITSQQITVTQPGTLSATDAHTNVTCNGGTDGTVTLTFSGGTGPYMVNFNGGGFIAQTSPKVYTGLAAGTYTWIVRDANNCTAEGSEVITQASAMVATDAHTNVTCNGGTDGTVTLTFSGGTGPYMVNFNGGGFVTQTSPKVYTGLAAGTYTWIVRDANNCTAQGSEVITQASAISLSLTQVNAPCGTSSGGTITATYSGGTAPYMVRIDGGAYAAQTSPYTFTGVSAGSHTIWVRDANGCEKSAVIIVGTSACQGCSPGFWKNHTELWDQLTDYPPAHMPAGLQFITTTNYFTYFGLAPGANGFPNSITMHGAISQGGGQCKAFSRHAVAALLSSASGLNIAYPTGTSDFTSLYNAIRTALQTGNCGGILFSQLEAISEADESMCGVFSSLSGQKQLAVIQANKVDLNVVAYPNPYVNNTFRLSVNSPVSGVALIEIYTIDGIRISSIKQSVRANTNELIPIIIPGLTKSTIVYRISIDKYNARGTVLSPN